MKKLLLKSILLLCALITGTSAWAVEQVYTTCTFTTGASGSMSDNVQNYTSTWTNTIDGHTWTLVNFNNNNRGWTAVKAGPKGDTENVSTITSDEMDEAITKVRVTVDAISNGSVTAAKLEVSTVSTFATIAETVNATSSTIASTGDWDFEIETPTENCYYRLTFTCNNNTTGKSGKNGVISVSQIEYYYDYVTAATLDHITLSGTYPTEFYVGDAFSHEGMTVTAHYSDASSLDVTSSATFTGYNMSSAGDQTVTVSYEESSVEKTTTYDITVSPVPPVVLTLDFATNIFGLPVGNSNKVTASTGYSYGGYTYTLAAPDGFYYLEATTPSTYKCLFMGKSGATLTFPAFPFKVKMIKVYGTPGASGSVTQNIFVGDAAISTETTGAKDVTNVYSIPSAYQAIGTVYVLKVTSSANTQISKIEILGDGEAVEVSAAGLATFASNNKLDFTNVPDLEAYIAKESAGVITLEQVNKVDAGTGVLLRALNGTTAFGVPVTTADADDATGNKFVRGNNAAIATSEGGNYNWILSKKGEVIGFYHANGNTVASNRAYLQTTTASARILLDFDDVDVTAIENVEVQKVDGQYFNLAGQRVANPTKGLYIVNGKKVVIK